MRYLLQGLFGERSLTKVAAVFPSEQAARQKAEQVVRAASLSPGQVRVLGPDDARQSRRTLLSASVEPEQAGIWRTIVRAHVVLGALGAVAGWAIYAGFRAAGNAAVLASPRASLGVCVVLGLVFGLFAGGLVALRPDHVQLLNTIRSALRSGSWVVIVHPASPEQTQHASGALQDETREVLRTL